MVNLTVELPKQAIFDQMDVDGNGTLQTEEVNRALTLLGIDRDLERLLSSKALVIYIYLYKYIIYTLQYLVSPISSFFCTYICISLHIYNDICTFTLQILSPASFELLVRLVEELDSTRDGRVSFQEFLAWWRKHIMEARCVVTTSAKAWQSIITNATGPYTR